MATKKRKGNNNNRSNTNPSIQAAKKKRIARIPKAEYAFSVVMSVYNVEPYINEAIDSLIEQDYGFSNIQLILVDDGSTDNSGLICDEYKQRYPKNIIVIHKENGGQSSARNAGIKRATGEFINFVDPDDYLSKNTFSAVAKFIAKHGTETDVIAIPLIMFGDKNGPHPLNSKFGSGTRVIDLNKEWTNIQMSLASSFIRLSVARKYAFEYDSHLVAAEDAKELTKIMMLKQTLGVVSEAKYHYRTHEASTISGAQSKKGWYIEYAVNYLNWALDYAQKRNDRIPKYIQYAIMRDTSWKLLQKEVPEGLLNDEELTEYKTLLYEIIKRIDDDVIMAQNNIWTEQKSLIFKIKYDSMPRLAKWGNSVFYLVGSNTIIFDAAKLSVHINFVDIINNQVKIEGWYPHYIHLDEGRPSLFVNANGKRYPITKCSCFEEKLSIGECIYKKIHFVVTIPLQNAGKTINLVFYRERSGINLRLTNIDLVETYLPISKQLSNSYYWHDGWKLQYRGDKFCLTYQKKNKWQNEKAFLKEILPKSKKAFVARILYRALLPLKKKPIWLIADKANRADDNGEAFFKYCVEHGEKGIKYIFLVGKDTSDYARLKKIGLVVPYMSKLHKFLFLFADVVISAYSHGELNNPFGALSIYYKDIMRNCKFVFLQHGVTKDDVSSGLNKFTKDLSGFVTAAKAEYDSILNTPAYIYDEKQAWLTGMPRYDLLYHAEKKSIAIMPTWRRDLFGHYNSEDSSWDLKEGFHESAYFQFYNALFHNEKLLSAAKEYGYEIEYIPHPIFFPYLDQFSVPDQIKMGNTDTVYRDVFARNQLLVTDFSSVAFDFSYLRKPLIYAHFDSNHYAEGYFDYERDGFGEVEYDLDSTVERIIEYMKDGCQLKPVYRERIEQFYAFNDRENSKRVYEKIKALNP